MRFNKIVDTNSRKTAPGGRVNLYWSNTQIGIYYKSLRRTSKYSLPKALTPPVDANVISDYFNISGLEFGNWTSQEDRLNFLGSIALSLTDLYRITGIKNIGLDKKIGIAYGARGRGGAAAAHFEPGTFMINLTKEWGAGSFAHEYGHALDYFFGLFIEPDKIRTSLTGGASIAKPTKAELKELKPGSMRYNAVKIIYDLTWDGVKKTRSRIRLEDKFSGDYWFRRTEIFARAFEQYVHYKLIEKGIINRYLNKSKYEAESYIYPVEFKKVVPLFDRLLKQIAIESKK